MSRRYAFLFLALLQLNFLLGCSSGPNGATALSEVESAHADLIAAYNTCNAEAFTSRYASAFTFTTSNTRTGYSTPEALRSYLAAGCRQKPSPYVTLKAQSVRLIGHVAIASGQYVFRVAAPSCTTELTQNFTVALLREAGQWKVSAHHVSLVP